MHLVCKCCRGRHWMHLSEYVWIHERKKTYAVYIFSPKRQENIIEQRKILHFYSLTIHGHMHSKSTVEHWEFWLRQTNILSAPRGSRYVLLSVPLVSLHWVLVSFRLTYVISYIVIDFPRCIIQQLHLKRVMKNQILPDPLRLKRSI